MNELLFLSRFQFALTACYHWLFVPLTLGLGIVMSVMETLYVRSGDSFWKRTAQFWQKLFGINFAVGVATGIILEFEFGTNWSNYSWFVGDIFGAPLAIEGIVAFFMESTFVAIMFFGWNKVSRGVHLASTWLTGLGATFSAWWILVANSWMQYPVGCTFNPDTMRNEMVSFAEVALSPFAVNKFCHTVTSAWIIGALFTVAVSCYYLLRKREKEMALKSLRVGSGVGLVGILLAMQTGDGSAYNVAQVQPMKLAAMEALYNGGTNQGLTAIALVNPFSQPDYENEESPALKIDIPYALSFLATRDIDGFVPGVNDILKGGYKKADGTVEPSVDEKIDRGKKAIVALKDYRKLKSELKGKEPSAEQTVQLSTLKASIDKNMKYFGYGYVTDKASLVPSIPLCFYAFRVMVGLGSLFLLFFVVSLYLSFKKDLSQPKFKWFNIAAIALVPLGYICSESGWLVAEFGRQPWAIQDLMPTWVGVSNVGSGSVALTFFIFLALFTALLAVEISIMLKAIKKGPEENLELKNKELRIKS